MSDLFELDGVWASRGGREVLRDLNERRMAADVLSAERERFRVTLASIGDAVIVTDQNGAVTFLNPVAAGLTGPRRGYGLFSPGRTESGWVDPGHAIPRRQEARGQRANHVHC